MHQRHQALVSTSRMQHTRFDRLATTSPSRITTPPQNKRSAVYISTTVDQAIGRSTPASAAASEPFAPPPGNVVMGVINDVSPFFMHDLDTDAAHDVVLEVWVCIHMVQCFSCGIKRIDLCDEYEFIRDPDKDD